MRARGWTNSCLPHFPFGNLHIPRGEQPGLLWGKGKTHLTCPAFPPPPEATGRLHPGAGHTEALEMFLFLRLLLVWIRTRRRYRSKKETEQAADVSFR